MNRSSSEVLHASVKSHGEYEIIGRFTFPLRLSNGEVCEFAFEYFEFPSQQRYLALVKGEIVSAESCLVRINSRCIWGELGSEQCDCRWQFEEAKRLIAQEGRGLIIYAVDHLGKGVGLRRQTMINTVAQGMGIEDLFFDAYKMMGYKTDYRSFSDSVSIVKHYGVQSVRLLTNNVEKIKALEEAGIPVERVPIQAPITPYNKAEVIARASKAGHLIIIEES